MAFYLKYRPQTLDELLGQEAVKKTLLSAFWADKLSHAYLLVGPRGTGKTSTARILAKMVNCSSEKNLVPCNKCNFCISITDGSNLDLIEIDAASNNSVEDIRSLREKVRLAPTSAKKKVYIIDEVHMLSNSAFNALLKTLEEPPAHVLFILATTEAQKIPATILSRTQRLDFKLASQEEIKKGLLGIVKAEKLSIEDLALIELAKLADGSFRDSVKLLEQLAALDKKIELEDVLTLLRSTKFETALELLKQLAQKQTKEALANLNKQVEAGTNIKELLMSILEMLRHLLLIKNDLGQLVAENLSEDKYKQLFSLAKEFEIDSLLLYLEVFSEALEKLRFASIQILPLELAVMKMGIRKPAIKIEEQKISKPVAVETENVVISGDKTKLSAKTDTQIPPSGDVNKLLEKWNFVLETVKPYNFSLAALLGSVKIVSCDAGVVTLEVPYSFHQRILEAPKSKDLLQSVLSDVLEKPTVISVILGERPLRTEDVANVEVAEDDEIVRMAAEIFNGKLVD